MQRVKRSYASGYAIPQVVFCPRVCVLPPFSVQFDTYSGLIYPGCVLTGPHLRNAGRDTALSKKTALADSASTSRTIDTQSTFAILQTLVTIALSYQLLFSPNSTYVTEVLEFVVLGLLFILILVLALPNYLWRTPLIVWGLIVGDTFLCANVFYMVGFAEPGLYITLVLFILLAAVAPSMNLYFALSLGICAIYGIIWYTTIGKYQPFSEGNLLQFPVLLIMANFYWYILGMRRTVPSVAKASNA
jgi:hypothetical protein